MSQKIEVRYTQIGLTGVYHKTIVYTDSIGDTYVAEADGRWAAGAAAMGSIIARLTPPVVAIPSTATAYAVGGTIYATTGYKNLSEDTDHRELIAEESDLSSEWSAIVSAMSSLTAGNYIYLITAQNSNTAVDYALDAAGLSAPQEDDFEIGEYWSPGSDGEFN